MWTVHLLLPAYNEEMALPGLLERLAEFSSTLPKRLVVWVVDDGSTDRTLNVAEAGTTGLDTKVVVHTRNLGLGQAVNSGIQAIVEVAGPEDILVLMDADDTHDVGLIMPLVQVIDDGADISIASRFVRGGDDSTAPWYRRLLSRVAARIFRQAFPLGGIRDFTSGYRAYRTSLIEVATHYWGQRLIEEQGFACMVELLLKLRHWDPVILEVPMVLRYDRKQGESKLKIIRTVRQYMVLALRDRLQPTPRIRG